jgi:hypothetical protein
MKGEKFDTSVGDIPPDATDSHDAASCKGVMRLRGAISLADVGE